ALQAGGVDKYLDLLVVPLTARRFLPDAGAKTLDRIAATGAVAALGLLGEVVRIGLPLAALVFTLAQSGKSLALPIGVGRIDDRSLGACRNLELLRVRHWGSEHSGCDRPERTQCGSAPHGQHRSTALGGASRLGGPSEESDEALARLRH